MLEMDSMLFIALLLTKKYIKKIWLSKYIWWKLLLFHPLCSDKSSRRFCKTSEYGRFKGQECLLWFQQCCLLAHRGC